MNYTQSFTGGAFPHKCFTVNLSTQIEKANDYSEAHFQLISYNNSSFNYMPQIAYWYNPDLIRCHYIAIGY